jgi:hypothetical protein
VNPLGDVDEDEDAEDDDGSDASGDSGEDEETSLFSGATPTPNGSLYENGVKDREGTQRSWWRKLIGGSDKRQSARYQAVQ